MKELERSYPISGCLPITVFRNIKDPRRGLLLLAYNHELESVVQFNAPCIRGIFRLAVICFRAEVVVSIQFYILLHSNTCFCCPELHACTIVPAIFQLICHIQSGVAEEIRTCISSYIVNTEGKAARFIQIHFSIAQSGCPQIGMFMPKVVFTSCLDEITVNLQAGITQSDGRAGAPGFYAGIINNIICLLYIFKIESRNVRASTQMSCQLAVPCFCSVIRSPRG